MSWKSRTWLDSWEIKFRDPDEPEWVLTNLRDWWSCRHDCGVEEESDKYLKGPECYHCGATPPKNLVGLEAMMKWSEQ